MRLTWCLLATLWMASAVMADDLPGESLGESRLVPTPPLPVPGPPPRSRGNSFRVISGSPFGSSAGYVVDGPVYEWYHAESSNPWADMPVYSPYGNYGGMYGPMMLDVLLFTDVSSRF